MEGLWKFRSSEIGSFVENPVTGFRVKFWPRSGGTRGELGRVSGLMGQNGTNCRLVEFGGGYFLSRVSRPEAASRGSLAGRGGPVSFLPFLPLRPLQALREEKRMFHAEFAKDAKGDGKFCREHQESDIFGTANMTASGISTCARNTFDLLHMNAGINGMDGFAGQAGCT